MTEQNSTKNMSKSSRSETDCLICTETVNTRKMIKCPFCDFETCGDCVTRFLLGILDTQPRCMNNSCKKIWSWEFLADNTPHSFHNKKYRTRRAQLLLEREKSMLPGTQELVHQEKQTIKNKKKIQDIMNETAMYRELIRLNDEKIRDIRRDGSVVKKKKERTFTRGCPVEDCRGFLSTSLKCGTCSTYSCKDCHLPKTCKKDEEHKCDPELVATVKLLNNDTKSCPACATPIYKISGCDQMYCTSCHTPFSWTTGVIETGVIHNPHYYQMQRELNGGVAPRNRGDVRCGGVPAVWTIMGKLRVVNVTFIDVDEAHRSIAHINNVELPRFPNHLGEVDNSRLRVDYLMQRIDEKSWHSKLKAKMKKQEKDGEINQILRMYTQTLSDLFGNIVDGKEDEVVHYMTGCNQLRDYTNKQLTKIGQRFGNVVPCIGPDWKFYRNSKWTGPQRPIKPCYARAPRDDYERERRERDWVNILHRYDEDMRKWKRLLMSSKYKPSDSNESDDEYLY